jgi:class 3 adenylate cyclase
MVEKGQERRDNGEWLSGNVRHRIFKNWVVTVYQRMTDTRKLAAIVAADVVGYSRLAGTDEERTLARPPPCGAI